MPARGHARGSGAGLPRRARHSSRLSLGPRHARPRTHRAELARRSPGRARARPQERAQYRAALALAKNDPDLQRTVAELERAVEPPKPPASADGLSFDEVSMEFLKNLPPPPPPPAPPVELEIENSEFGIREQAPESQVDAPDSPGPPVALEIENSEFRIRDQAAAPPVESGIPNAEFQIADSSVEDAEERERTAKTAKQTIVALEEFLDAIHVP